jgi:hypothetical protein
MVKGANIQTVQARQYFPLVVLARQQAATRSVDRIWVYKEASRGAKMISVFFPKAGFSRLKQSLLCGPAHVHLGYKDEPRDPIGQ